MNQFEVAQGFIEQCQAGAPVDVLARAFQRSTQEMFHEARRYGLTRGYTVPIHSVDAPRDYRASCSVVRDSESFEPAAYLAVQLMAFYLYDAASHDAQAKDGSMN